MREQATVVLDVGKTLTKLSLWDPDGRLVAQRSRPNARIDTESYLALDVDGIETFLRETLQSFAQVADVGAIIPIGHGAAAAIIDERGLVLPPLDYEHPIPASTREAYDEQRDSFALTGSPALPHGLNLGAQLHFLEWQQPGILSRNRRLVPWAQYWSWRLSGVAASEVTSLGCHTDLWHPYARVPSTLARSRGWSEHFPPLRNAAEVLGTLHRDWVKSTGLSRNVGVYCGLHDSNAALVAARRFAEISEEATILSTGTWFVAMRTPAPGEGISVNSLDERRDCLVNVNVAGNPVPSARFMGGREIELLTGVDARRIDMQSDQPALLASVSEILANEEMVLPTFAAGCGPFPHSIGRWTSIPDDEMRRCTAVALYLALVADVALDLIGSRERLLIEGRFSESQVFVRALAALRPNTRVYVCYPRSDVSFGALSLTDPARPSPSRPIRVEPLNHDLGEYRYRWRVEAERTKEPSK